MHKRWWNCYNWDWALNNNKPTSQNSITHYEIRPVSDRTGPSVLPGASQNLQKALHCLDAKSLKSVHTSCPYGPQSSSSLHSVGGVGVATKTRDLVVLILVHSMTFQLKIRHIIVYMTHCLPYGKIWSFLVNTVEVVYNLKMQTVVISADPKGGGVIVLQATPIDAPVCFEHILIRCGQR